MLHQTSLEAFKLLGDVIGRLFIAKGQERYVCLQPHGQKIFQHPNTGPTAWATMLYVVATLTIFNVTMALVVALLSTHMPKRAGFAFRVLWLLPRITPSVVYIMMWKFISAAEPYGILNRYLPFLGGENLLPNSPWVFVILTNGFVGASFGMILFASATVPPALEPSGVSL